jgi:hypothetical protein
VFGKAINHEQQCSANPEAKHAKTTHPPNQPWVERVDWAWLTPERLQAVCQPGCCVLLPSCNGTVKVLGSMHRQLAAHFGPERNREFWLASLFLPVLTLFRPSFAFQGDKEQRAVEQKRISMFRNGRLPDLYKMLLEAQAQARRSLAESSIRGFELEGHTTLKLLRGGKVADLLTSAHTRAALSHQEITSLLIPSQFPPLPQPDGVDADEHAREEAPSPSGADPCTPSPSVASSEDEDADDDDGGACEAVVVNHENLLRAFAKTKSARGCTGIPTRYWAILARGSNADRAIMRLVQDLCSNTLPACMRPILTSVHYSTLRHNELPNKVRAVGSNDALLKVAQRYCLQHEAARVKAWVDSTPEYAVGRPNGVAHMIGKLRLSLERADLAEPAERESFGILGLDISAAFPTASRPLMRQQLKRHLPRLLPLFDLMYGTACRHATLTELGEVLPLQQEQGIVQGSESSALLFSLLSQLALERTGRAEHYHTHLCKYLDDHYLFGNVQSLAEEFDQLRAAFASVGLQLQPRKSVVYMPFAPPGSVPACMQARGVAVASADQGLEVLGAPLGHPLWTRAQLRARADAFVDRLDVVKHHLTHQQRLHVLMHVASVFQHLQASTLPGELEAFNRTVDTAVERVFLNTFFPAVSAEMLNTVLPAEGTVHTFRDALCARASMPASLGGCAILSLQDRQACNFAITTARLAVAEPQLWGTGDTVLAQQLQKTMQSLGWEGESLAAVAAKDVATACLDAYRAQQQVLQEVAPAVMVRAMHAASLPGSGTFLFAAAADADRTLSDEEVGFAVRQRLGFGLAHSLGLSADPTRPAPGHCPTCSRDHADWEEHLTACKSTLLPRHDAVKHTLKRVCQAAGRRVQVEYTGLEPPLPHTPGLRVDLLVGNPNAGFNTAEHLHSAIDVTIGTCTQPAHLLKKERAKVDKYSDWGQANHATVVPFVMSTHGALGKKAQAFLSSTQRMASAADRYLSGVDEPWVPRWSRVLACVLVRAQAFHAMRLANNRNGTTYEKAALFTGVERELDSDADAHPAGPRAQAQGTRLVRTAQNAAAAVDPLADGEEQPERELAMDNSASLDEGSDDSSGLDASGYGGAGGAQRQAAAVPSALRPARR